MVKHILILLLGIAMIGGFVMWELYTWNDCLEENTFWTCWRIMK